MPSSSGWVTSAAHMASTQRRHSVRWPLSQATAAPKGRANKVSQNGACVSARCSTMLRIGSPWSISTSRSGRVPATAPQAAAFHTAVWRPITATPTAAPRAI